MHAANLVSEIKKIDSTPIFKAWGGDRLIQQNVPLVKHINTTSFMGIWNILKNLGSIRSNFSFCKHDILDFKPDALILVDYPGFNLKIAEFAKRNGVKVFYYISPKIWAWYKSRVLKIRDFVDHLLVIFPFEVDFYKKYGIDAVYVGNPLLDEISKKEYSISFQSSKPIIALLPGSRKQEIEAILPKMLMIIDDFTNYQFVIAATNTFSEDYYQSFIKGKNVGFVFNETYGLLRNARAALVTSGTATLETALFKVPQVVCYSTNWLTYIIASRLINIKYISLVNILLNKRVVPELIQTALNKHDLKMELNIVLNKKEDIIVDYNRIISSLNKEGASRNAAKFIVSAI